MRICTIALTPLTGRAITAHFRGRGHQVGAFEAGDPRQWSDDAGTADVFIVGSRRLDPTTDELLRTLHKQAPETPIVLVGDSAAQLTVSDALACGVHAILHEPVRLQEVELTVLRLTSGAAIHHDHAGGNLPHTP